MLLLPGAPASRRRVDQFVIMQPSRRDAGAPRTCIPVQFDIRICWSRQNAPKIILPGSRELDRKTGQSKRCWLWRRQLGSAVEQRFCKPWVVGSILTAGSTSKLRAQQWTLRGNKCNWRSKLPNRRAELRNATESGDSQSSPLRKFDDATNATVRVEGTNFAATFSRSAGTLTSLV